VHPHFVTSPHQVVREKRLPNALSPLLETCLLHSLFEPNVQTNWDLAQLQKVIVPFLRRHCRLTSPLLSLVSVLPATRALRQAYSRQKKTKSACKASARVKLPFQPNLRNKWVLLCPTVTPPSTRRALRCGNGPFEPPMPRWQETSNRNGCSAWCPSSRNRWSWPI
jgi:hypothetical protein